MKITLWSVAGAIGVGAIVVVPSPADGQTLMYSFETLYNDLNEPDPAGTRPDGFHVNGALTTVTQDTFGATEGTHSMKFAQQTLPTFTGAITQIGAPFPIIDTPTTTAISVDYTVRPGEEFTGAFANVGITVFGESSTLGEGQAQTVAAAENPGSLAAGTYRLIFPLIARNNPFTFDPDVSFESILGPDPATQMIASSFQFYVNKPNNAPLTAYFDNVRALGNQTSTWNADADGTWSDANNWLGLPVRVPSGVDAIAIFGLGPPITDNRTITVDSPRTVGTLYFNNGSSYTLAGTNALTLDVGSGPARIDSHNGSHTISAPLVLNDNLAIAVAPAASIFTISGPITATGRTITKSGPGRLDLSPINAAGLTVNAGAAMLLSGGGTSRVNDLTIAGGTTPTARLDITDNALVVDYTGPSSPIGTIQAQIASGYAGGSWNGNGIISSQGNALERGIGFAEASSLASVPPIFGTVDSTAVLLRLTRVGDANLDGTVNLQDFNRLASNFGTSGADWSEGDFNYDGTVNLQDFNRLAANFGLSAGPDGVVDPDDWAALASAIPEPATGAGALVLAAAPLVGRKRRRSRSTGGISRESVEAPDRH